MNEHTEFYLGKIEDRANEAHEAIRQAGIHAAHMSIFPFETKAAYSLRKTANKLRAVADEIDAILMQKVSHAIAA